MKALHRALFVVLLATATSSAQTVHVVDLNSGLGSDFTTVRAAVLAATEGDVILVRDGNYFFDDVTIDGKSLVVVEDEGATVSCGRFVVQNLAANQSVVFRGIDLTGGGVDGQAALRVTDCAGPVWFEDVRVRGDNMAFVAGGGLCRNSAEVVFTRCFFEPPFLLGPFTFELEDSSVTMVGTTVAADPGAGVFSAGPGADALLMTDGRLFLYDSDILGGDGGDGVTLCEDGAPGGVAITMQGTDPVVVVLDARVLGGTGGIGSGTCDDGADGPSYVMTAPSATVDTVNALARSYLVSSPVRENGTVQVSFQGQPGDRVWVRYPPAPGPSLLSNFWDGPFLVGLPAPRQFIGTLDGTGVLVQNIPLPNLGPSTEAVTFFTQAIFLGSRFVMSPPSVLVGLDSSF